MNFQTLKLELQKRCLDLGQIKRPDERYGEALNYALSQYPLVLCQRNIDSATLDTVEDQREYALPFFNFGITNANQVRRIWIDDDDGVPREVGRYEVQDDDGTIILVLDELPDGAYDITVEYWDIPLAMSDPTDTTDCDDDWLLAKAMLSLMGEADWTIDDAQRSIAHLEYWNARLMARERQLRAQRRRTSRKPRTTAWRQYVT